MGYAGSFINMTHIRMQLFWIRILFVFSNVSGKSRGSMIWKKMYYYFMYKHDEFLEHYHKRSNAETVFHAIKTKFKDNLRSKDKTAQVNELLLKVLCYNITVIIQEISTLGIKGEFVIEKKDFS
jgi:transposase